MRNLILALVFWTAPLMATDAILSWDAPAGAIGYHVYSGTNTHVYYVTNTVAPGTNTSITLLALTPGKTYYFAVSGTFPGGLESDNSVELVATIPTPPTNLRLRTTTQGSASIIGPWNSLTNSETIVEASGTNQFFRSLVQILKP